MKNLENIFTYHKPFGDQPQRYEKLRAAAKEYAYALLHDDVLLGGDYDKAYQAYLAYIKVVEELIPVETDECDKVFELAEKALKIATNYELEIVQLIQVASMFANAAIACGESDECDNSCGCSL